jgi:ComF family protein
MSAAPAPGARGPRAARLAAALAGGGAALARGVASRLAELEAFALPQRCPGCGASAEAEQLLCAACLERVPRLSFAVCARCLSRDRDPVGCARHPRAQVWPAWVYDERAALAVHALKYAARPGLALALARPLAAAVPARPAPDLVTAVPLHSARRRERGYNQAWLLATAVAGRLGVPALEDVLERTRATPAQARLDPVRRRRNLAGAFRVTAPARFRARRILVVDDVLTTGATLGACLDALAACGAEPAGAVLAWAQ